MDEQVRAVLMEPGKAPQVVILPQLVDWLQTLRWTRELGPRLSFTEVIRYGRRVHIHFVDVAASPKRPANVLVPHGTRLFDDPAAELEIVGGPVLVTQGRPDAVGQLEVHSLSDEDLSWVLETFALGGRHRI